MIIDEENLFSDEQDLQGAATGDTVSTDVVDLGAADRDIGRGEQLYLVTYCEETLDSSGDTATVQVQLETDADEAFSNPTVLSESRALAEGDAEVTDGGRVVLPIPPGVEQFIRTVYNVGGESPTAGKFTSFITHTVPDPGKTYPDAIS